MRIVSLVPHATELLFALGLGDDIVGVTHEELVNRIRRAGHRDARVLDKPEALAGLIASRAQEGDYVVCLGAGNITQWAAALPGELGVLLGKEPEAA